MRGLFDRVAMRSIAWLAVAITAAAFAPGCGGGDDNGTTPPVEVPDAADDLSAVDVAHPDVVADTSDEPEASSCVRRTCAQVGANCGNAPDGCDGIVACGDCPSGQTCGAGGPNHCAVGSCAPKGCVQLDASCGWISDGCADAIDCGGCAAPADCGGSGVENQCGCSPKTCAELGASCGRAPDGCGGIVSCGECPSGSTCGGAGPYLCGHDTCAQKSCAQVGASCGVVSDGCSDVLDCGDCVGVDVCGGTGMANQCGCTPKTCVQLGASCGEAPNHCGGIVDCGACPDGESCGGGGVPNQCGCACQVPHAQTACEQGQCQIAKCDDGWADCDGQVATGCETDLDTNPDHCGSCTMSCPEVDPDACHERTCAQGTCQELPRAQGSPCDDHDACTIVDACDDAGACVPGTPKSCQGPPNTQCWEANGACDPSTGQCSYTPKSAGQACDADGNACTVGDVCDGAGTCVTGAAKFCNTPPNTLCYNTNGTCNTNTGACTYPPKANGTACGTCKTCSNGTCGNAANGTACGTVCQYCSSGSCATRPNGYQYDATESHRCCSGGAVDISTNASHCGGCGLACSSGACQSAATPTACSPHPGATTGRCTCTANSQCPKGRNGLNQTCRTLTPGANLCAPSNAEYCASGESYQDISSCPNYCFYP